MAKELTSNVLVLDEQGNPLVLEAGQTVPAKYADQVGDHCYGQDPGDDEKKPARARASK